MKEPDYEEMMRGRVRYLPPRFMSVNVAIEQMVEVEDRLQQGVLRYTCANVDRIDLYMQLSRTCLFKRLCSRTTQVSTHLRANHTKKHTPTHT